MNTLSLALIVKNEQENIGRLLTSVSGVFDQIVIVDTGSTDDTKAISSSFGAEIYDFKWISDFSAARNFAFSKTASDYTMWLDADDEILPADKQKLLELKSKLGSHDAYLMVYNYAQDEFGHCAVQVWRHRIVRKGISSWRYPIHECMNFKHGYTETVSDVVVTHRRTIEDALKDRGRNIKILRQAIKDFPGDQRMKYYFAKELFGEGDPKECVEAFKKYFNHCTDWHDNQVNGYWYMANSYLQMGNEEQAIATCLKAINMDPRFAEFYVIIGQIHYNAERWEKAIPWFELASKCQPPNSMGTLMADNYTWVPYDRLCRCYSGVGAAQAAYDANERALGYRPNDARLLNNRESLRNTLFPGRHMERPIRLSLGSGGKFTNSYRNTDLFPGTNISEVFNQSSLPYSDSSIHAIYSEHALEHCAGHDAAEQTITEWARALRSGGYLKLKVPDLDLCCEGILRSEDRAAIPGERFAPKEWYKYTLFGIQRSQGSEPPEGQYHRTGFSKGMLRRLLEKNGFDISSMNNYDGWGTPSIEVDAVLGKKLPRICWLIPGKVDPNNGSLRIRCLNVSNWLQNNGVDSKIIEYGPDDDVFQIARRADVVVMIGFGEKEFKLIQRLRKSGVSVIQEHCEDLDSLPFQSECFGAASIISCCSSVLAEKAEKYGRTITLHDAFEEPPIVKSRTYEPHGWNGKLRVVWCGMGGNAQNAESIRHIIEPLGMELRIISEWDSLCYPPNLKWNKDTWLDDLADADIVISPQRHWIQPAKSNTKATQAMALGMPVLGSPIRSYLEAIRHGENGFISSTPEEWERDLRACMDQSVRERIGRAAKIDAYKNYSINAIGQRWKELIVGLSKENCNPPSVDIIIPTWNNLELLKHCIQSIRHVTDWPHTVIVVNSGNDGTKDWLATQPDIIAINTPERLHFSPAINAGLSVSKADYVCLLNDDTIVSSNWLNGMMHEAMKPGVGAVNPFSNCDKGWLHDENISIDGIDLIPSMSLETIAPIIPKICNLSHDKVVTERPWVAFFATVIPRKVINTVGKLDEQFKSGCEDADYCRRIAAAGFRMLTTYDSVVFHFGGATRKKSELVNNTLHHDEDKLNHSLFAAKYDGKPKKFVLYTGPAWEKWSPNNIDTGGIGGSETCAIYVAKEFTKRGYDSYVFSDCDGLEGEYDGVHYFKHEKIGDFVSNNYIDIFVSSRRPEIFDLPIKARKKICWVHDIWLHHDSLMNVNADKIDEFFCLSPWHKHFFSSHHKSVNPSKIYITRNGIDLERFKRNVSRERGRLIYTSSPDRGLDILLDCLPMIQKSIPEANLHVFYGFKNWEEALKMRKVKSEIAWMENLKRKLRQPGVNFHGRIGQSELAQEFMKSELWAYPTYFTETYCISAVEAMAAGLPVITSNLAALNTTVGNAGILFGGDPRSEAYRDGFVNCCIEILSSPHKWNEMSKRSLEKASQCTWPSIIDEWISHLG